MGIFDDMENFIIDHFTVTKRHNVQQTFEISSQQQQQQQQTPGLVNAPQQHHQHVSQQVVSIPGPTSSHRPSHVTRPATLVASSSGSAERPGRPLESVRPRVENSGSVPVVSSEVTAGLPSTSLTQHPPHQSDTDPTTVTSPFFRELLSWGEHTSNVAPAFVEQRRSSQALNTAGQFSPQVERVQFRSPQLERSGYRSPQFRTPSSPLRTHRTSWIEQSTVTCRSPSARRSFSFEHVSSPPGLRRMPKGSFSSDQVRSAQPEALPPTPPTRAEREHQRSTPQSENLPPNSPFRTDRPRSSLSHGRNSPTAVSSGARSPQSENRINSAICGESPPMLRAMTSPLDSQLSNAEGNTVTSSDGAVSVVHVVSKPKLVRLRSEPCSPSFSNMGLSDSPPNCCSAHSGGFGFERGTSTKPSRRRREELKRSQSFEARSPSCEEAYLLGINIPTQLVITRPQLCRSRLNRKHLSLHLEGMTGDLNSLRASPLQFHDVHGDNIELLNNKTRARRYDSFCKGICFSNRPININERVYVKFVETNTNWSGVLRFGFTNVDPATLRGCDLPRYACPDLTNKPGHWAKALGERYTASNILLHFSVTRAGDVNYGVNGEEKGLFFSGVATDHPVWAMLDIYGNTVGVEFSHANAEIEPGQFDASPAPVGGSDDVFSFSSLSLEDASSIGSGGLGMGCGVGGAQPARLALGPPTPGTPPGSQAPPVVQYHAGVNLTPMPLHGLQGRNIRVSTDRRIAARLREEYCNAYIFTARPLRCGETIVLQILSVDRTYIGGLGFGLTACDPATVEAGCLPDDADNLLDRLEYWVVNKDVCRNPEIGDEISFFLSESGEVKYARNNQAPVTLMHVDRTLPLWAFFDVYGNIQKIQILGTTMTHVQGRLPRSQSLATSRLITGGSGGNGSMSSGNQPPAPAQTLRSNSTPVPCLPSPLEPSPVAPFFAGVHPPHMQQQSPQRHSSIPQPNNRSPYIQQQQQPMSAPCTPVGGGVDDLGHDCKVCWEQQVNCVLYTCGHMCLCFDCASKIRSQNGLCPICRQAIVDVIRTYRS